MPFALTVLAVALYLAAALWQARALPGERSEAARLPAALGLAAATAHLGLHLYFWQQAGGWDLHFFAALSLVGAVTAALTASLGLTRPLGALGVVVYPLAAAALVLYRYARPQPTTPSTMDWQIQLHAGLALLAYAALGLAALLAIMLWWQEHALRRRRFGAVLRMLPPLTQVETLMFRLIGAGFALLTLALLSGVVFVENLFAQHLVHKTVLSLLAWGVFGTLLLGRRRHGWRGRRAVRLTLTAMILLGLAFFGSKFVLELVLSRGG